MINSYGNIKSIYKNDALQKFDFHRLNSTNCTSLSEYAEKSLIFFTVMFDQNAISSLRQMPGKANCQHEVDASHHLFRQACWLVDKMQGVSGRRERPLALVATDHANSKYGSFKAAGAHNLHIHGLWAVKPEDRDDYLKALNSLQLRMLFPHLLIEKIEAEPFSSSRGSADQAVDYVLKAWVKATLAPTQWSAIDWVGGAFRFPIPKRKIPTQLSKLKAASKRKSAFDFPYAWEA